MSRFYRSSCSDFIGLHVGLPCTYLTAFGIHGGKFSEVQNFQKGYHNIIIRFTCDLFTQTISILALIGFQVATGSLALLVLACGVLKWIWIIFILVDQISCSECFRVEHQQLIWYLHKYVVSKIFTQSNMTGICTKVISEVISDSCDRWYDSSYSYPYN